MSSWLAHGQQDGLLRNHSVNRQANAVHPDKTSLTNILNMHTHALKLATFAGWVCVTGTRAKLERPNRVYTSAITFYLHLDPELQQNTVIDNQSDITILRIYIIINIRVLLMDDIFHFLLLGKQDRKNNLFGSGPKIQIKQHHLITGSVSSTFSSSCLRNKLSQQNSPKN